MSYVVETLLLNKDLIRADVEDLENDEFNNLLQVESQIDSMIRDGLLSVDDRKILYCVLDSPTFEIAAQMAGHHRIFIAEKFKSICDRIGYMLGGIFTDEGYLDYLRKEYGLSEEQLEKAIKYMSSQFRYKVPKIKNA